MIRAKFGSSATISCPAKGGPNDITYTWIKDGVQLAGQTTSNITIVNFSYSNFGQYKCIPHNSEGNHNSTIADLHGIIS